MKTFLAKDYSINYLQHIRNYVHKFWSYFCWKNWKCFPGLMHGLPPFGSAPPLRTLPIGGALLGASQSLSLVAPGNEPSAPAVSATQVSLVAVLLAFHSHCCCSLAWFRCYSVLRIHNLFRADVFLFNFHFQYNNFFDCSFHEVVLLPSNRITVRAADHSLSACLSVPLANGHAWISLALFGDSVNLKISRLIVYWVRSLLAFAM